ncbi:MAG: 50S ribosomal protein L24e [Candidatus Thermoplasmatota archaeon]|nr:50S ribosomal protein L24e [Candidatus Thermoplasmatota archaeon]MCJ2563692.1 50S ribosomal protein L24e [Candidatus Thermoplasmatota archaeon]
MVQARTCTFCGERIEPGTGKMYIKKDGTFFYFCSGKCQKNSLKLGRVPRRTRWTRRYPRKTVKAEKREAPAGDADED